MKANRTFVQADDAVSPVIAVILMVAITVVLAATVFVLVSDIGNKGGKAAPAMSFTQDDPGDRLVVSSAATTADWNRLAVRLKAATPSDKNIFLGSVAKPYQNKAAGTTGGNLGTGSAVAGNIEVSDTNAAIGAADSLAFCASGGTAGPTSQVTVTVIDTASSAVIGDYTFANLAVCPGGT